MVKATLRRLGADVDARDLPKGESQPEAPAPKNEDDESDDDEIVASIING